jgi:DHA1 family bicyclomycin/chloramphenicol resistance-like MFS transporter
MPLSRLDAARSRPAASNPLFLGALGLLMSFGPMSTDMYLPALPAIGVDFGVGQGEVQWSLSMFFLGFGVGQLVWGALGDRLGRRRPVAAGILLYLVGCIGCSLAGDAWHLAAWRFVQALGACAGPVLARAMVRDVFERDRAASVLSLMMLIMGIAPLAAPVLGGQILRVADWRAIFWAQAGFGILALAGLAAMPETLPLARRSTARFAGMVGAYLRLLASRRYLGYAAGSAFIYGGMFAFISGTPFVYIELYGVGPQNYGYLFGINIVGMIIVNTINSRIVLRFGADRVLRAGCALAALFGVLLLVSAAAGWAGLAGIVVPLFLFMAMTGLITANAMAGAMQAFPHAAGAASAFAGMLQFGFGAISGAAVGFLANGSAVPMAGVICACGLLSLALNLWLVTRRA